MYKDRMPQPARLPTTRDLRGNVITVQDLPPGDTKRWTPNKKAIVVRAVRNGLLPLEAVLERYHMTEKEFLMWEQGLKSSGVDGLKVTHYQSRRKTPSKNESGPT